MVDLTTRQQQILDFIRAEAESGRPGPTLREIAQHFGFRAHRAAACHLAALKKKGVVESDPGKARSLRVVPPFKPVQTGAIAVPLFGSIPAGFAQDRNQDTEGFVLVDFDTLGFKPTRTTFALRVTGHSMVGRHIVPGDVVILEHGAEPRDGDVVAALIDGQTTLKTFLNKNGKPFLRSENPNYPNLLPAHELLVQGVFRGLIRKASIWRGQP